ncbi:MAG TPA: hypothetical protein VFA21_22375 [Pyrinomonadaceae bacterium]|nr:hypothetical protein [Pyrinomonadaceae bacterium]
MSCLISQSYKAASLIVVGLLCLFLPSIYAQNKKQPLTNIDIINMTKEKVDDAVIIRAIQTSPTNFDVSANGLIQLKKGRVKKKIIELMQQVTANRDTPESRSATPTSMTQQFAFFKIELLGCVRKQYEVTCTFNITDNGPEAVITPNPDETVLVDDLGNAMSPLYSSIDGKSEPHSVENRIPPVSVIKSGATIQGWFAFSVFSDMSVKVARLKIKLDIDEYHKQENFSIEFRDFAFEMDSTN